MTLRRDRPGRSGWKLVLFVLVPLVLSVSAASAAENTDLTNPDVRLSDGFYPCPVQTDFSRAPLVEECLNPDLTRRVANVVAPSTTCNPTGTSTIVVEQRVSGSASAQGSGWLGANALTWSLTATIGPQDLPAQPNVAPFPDDGTRMDSVGFATGAVQSLSGSFGVDRSPSGAGPEDISGTVSLTPNGGNWGVCRTFVEEPSGSPVFGPAPITGEFFVVNGGVLTYEVTAGPAGLMGETGIAEAYFMNTFATCCDAESPTQVGSASGHFKQQFGTTHPASGTSGTAATPVGSNVTVSDFGGPGSDVGGVSVTFGGVTAAGDTSVTLMTSAPDLPAGFQVGDPPAFYEISTDAGVTPPIVVCLPYGSLPAGTAPRLLHYEDGEWVDRTTEVRGPPENEVCGVVDSLSPFAAVFESAYTVTGPFAPVDPQPTVNSMKAGRTVPVVFSLGGDFGLGVFEDGYPKSVGGVCEAGPTDSVETTSTNASGLQYDPSTGRYQYNWKTSREWKGHCRTLILRFDTGQELRASFRFS